MFAYPHISAEMRGVFLVSIVFACIFEVLTYILLSQFLVYSKLSATTAHIEEMARDGQPSHIDCGVTIDNAADDLAKADRKSVV